MSRHRDTAIVAGVGLGGAALFLATRGSQQGPPPGAPPAAPTGLTVTAITQTSAVLSWQASNGATSYLPEVNHSAGTEVSTTSVTLIDLTPGTTYHADVIAKNAAGPSAASALKAFTTLNPSPTVPPVPTGLAASNVTATACDLAWTEPSGTGAALATAYDVFEGATKIATVTAKAAHVTGLTPSTPYHFAVDATGSGGTSAQCAPITVTTPAANTPPPATPTGLAVVGTPGSTSLVLGWNPVAADTTHGTPTTYTVLEHTTKLTPVAATVHQAMVSGLTPNTSYPFSVLASNQGGDSAASAPITVKTAAGGPPSGNLDTVVIVLMENHNLAAVQAQCPNLMAFAAKGALAANYACIGHPSLPNYMHLTGGMCPSNIAGTGGHGLDCDSCMASNQSIFDVLDKAGISWGMFSEGQGTQNVLTPFPGGKGGYDNHHNPAAHYTSVNPSKLSKVVDLAQLSMSAIPRFTFVAPNVTNDWHSSKSPAPMEAWWQAFSAQVLGSPAFAPGKRSLLVCVFDEGSGPIYCAFGGPAAKAGVKSAAKYNHYSLLRTVTDGFGIGHVGPGDAAASPMTDMLA